MGLDPITKQGFIIKRHQPFFVIIYQVILHEGTRVLLKPHGLVMIKRGAVVGPEGELEIM